MKLLDPGNPECTEGLAGEIYANWTADPASGFATLTDPIRALLRSQCYQWALSLSTSLLNIRSVVRTPARFVEANNVDVNETPLTYLPYVGERVLLRGQTTQAENGVYIIGITGQPLVRDTGDGTEASLHPGELVPVFGPSEPTLWMLTSEVATIGKDPAVYQQVGSSGGGSSGPTSVFLCGKSVSKLGEVAQHVGGAGLWVPARHDVTGSRTVKLEVVAACTAAYNIRVRLWSVTAGAFVSPLSGAVNYLQLNNLLETTLTSLDLRSATNFNPAATGIYRLVFNSEDANARAVIYSAHLVVGT